MSDAAPEPCFIDGARGRLFALLRAPPAGARHAVLVAPPFGDEMNKSRKSVSDLAQALAARGLATLVVDLFGTGDSEGDFRDARWDGWVEDLLAAVRWGEKRGLAVTGLLGIRAGALLAAEMAQRIPGVGRRSVFWQPVADGSRFMTQFLRIRVAASLMDDSHESVGELRARILRGEEVEIGGYVLSVDLFRRIEAARLVQLATESLGQILWIEVTAGGTGELPAGSMSCANELRARLPGFAAAVVAGDPFWISTEIVRLPRLIERTVDAFVGPA